MISLSVQHMTSPLDLNVKLIESRILPKMSPPRATIRP